MDAGPRRLPFRPGRRRHHRCVYDSSPKLLRDRRNAASRPRCVTQTKFCYHAAFARRIMHAEPAMKTLDEYLDLAAQAHGHLCAGQVLGVRMAMLGLRELGIDDPVAERKRLVTFVEIDRCVTDAVALVANCRLGKRALKF